MLIENLNIEVFDENGKNNVRFLFLTSEEEYVKVLHIITFINKTYFRDNSFAINDDDEDETYHEENVYKHLLNQEMKSIKRKYKKDTSKIKTILAMDKKLQEMLKSESNIKTFFTAVGV